MRVSAFTLFTVLSSLAGVLASDVVDLTSASFKSEVLSEPLALVEFFAPWCGHCKNLAPHYEEAATELKSAKKIKLAKVDCTEQQEVCSQYGVTGYPTLKVFRNGVPTDYAGPRKADGIISYMVKQSMPAITDVTPESHEEFIKADKVVLVAYGNNVLPIPQVFKDYASTARDSYLFGQMVSTQLPSLPGIPKIPAIVLYKSFDEGYASIGADELADMTAESLEEFVKTNSVPLMDEISPENFGSYAGQGLPIAYLFVDPAAVSTRETLVEELRPLAKTLKGLINFVWIDGVKFVDHGKSLNIPQDTFPAFVIQDLAKQTKYPLSGKVTKETVEQFMQDFADDKIQPSIKSAPVPATQEEPVYKLVADGWDALFGDNSKDVFAEFMAPWCGHCQRLAPIWDTLGEKYSSNKNIVIAQMDATENDIPPQAPFKVSGFPTLKFRPAGSDEFIDYNGDRSLESLVEFVEEHISRNGSSARAEEDDEDEDDEEVIEHDEL